MHSNLDSKFNEKKVSRRNLLKGTAAGAVALGSGLFLPEQLTQAKSDVEIINGTGFYRFAVGDFKVTSISDGMLTIPTNVFATNASQTSIDAVLETVGLTTEPAQAPMNVALLETSDSLILFDTGGKDLGPIGGQLTTALSQLGHAPEDITHVVFTHAHPDHVGGTIDADGNPIFSQAQHFMSETEWTHWLSQEGANAEFITSHILPLENQMTLFQGDEEILPGIYAISTPGHTPGHMAYSLSSNDEKLVLTGDVSNHYVLSLKKPDWHLAFDSNPEKAVETRIAFFNHLADAGTKVLGYHFPFPGVGYVVASRTFENQWSWLPSM